MTKTRARITSSSGAQSLFYVPNEPRDKEAGFFGHWMNSAQVSLDAQNIHDAKADAEFWQRAGWELHIERLQECFNCVQGIGWFPAHMEKCPNCGKVFMDMTEQSKAV